MFLIQFVNGAWELVAFEPEWKAMELKHAKLDTLRETVGFAWLVDEKVALAWTWVFPTAVTLYAAPRLLVAPETETTT